jgi:hypothetical protein
MTHTGGFSAGRAGTLGAGRGSCRTPPVVFFSFIWDSPRFSGAFLAPNMAADMGKIVPELIFPVISIVTVGWFIR